MDTKSNVTARVTRRFIAPPERVFDAWLDARTAAKWLFATPAGQMVRAEVDPRVGGSFVFVDRRDGKDVTHAGSYLEIERPRRLAFTFGVDGTEGTRVVVDIAPIDGGSELTLTHELAPGWEDFADRAREGWSMILDGLAVTLGEH
jgi:uncharacterized protein YndB with AHSA1/START domain